MLDNPKTFKRLGLLSQPLFYAFEKTEIDGFTHFPTKKSSDHLIFRKSMKTNKPII